MKIKLFICTILCCLALPSFAQQKFDIRYVMQDMDCDAKTVCYEVQLKSGGGNNWGLAGQNYRLYYDASIASYKSGRSNLPASYDNYTEVQQAEANATGGGTLPFESTLGFLNYAIDLKESGSGGISLTQAWTTTSTICFDIKPAALTSPGSCFNLIWGREAMTGSYFTAYVEVNQWVGRDNTTQALGGIYNDMDSASGNDACFASACTTTPVDPCAGKGDADGDGICDDVDNCKTTANPNQADADQDGTGDVCDSTPNGPCSGLGDADGDGVCDNVDNCKTTANPNQADADQDGTGDVCDSTPNGPCGGYGDTDGDGICDNVDNCKTTANANQADADQDGIGDLCDTTPNGAITSTGGAKQFDIRYVMKDVDCAAKTVCYEVQLRSTSGTWGLAGQNYRLYYDASMASYKSGQSNLPASYDSYTKVQAAEANASVGGALSFESNLGFLNYAIDLKELGTGGISLSQAWTTTSTLCFDIKPAALNNNASCFNIVWGREAMTQSYFDAYVEVSEWVGRDNTTRAIGRTYNDMSSSNGNDACLASACTTTPVDPCAGYGDTDGDGVCDNVDNCKTTANPNQADADNDGKGDVCDTTPQGPCGGYGDGDGDGICNNVDNCITTYNPDQADADNDGIGDACDTTVPTTPYSGTQSYAIQFKMNNMDCDNKKVCYDVQVKSTSGTWKMGGQNYRIFYNTAVAEYTNGVSRLGKDYEAYKMVQDFQHQSAGGSLSFGNDLGFLNYSIDLKDSPTGGVALSPTTWTTTSSICFDLTAQAIEDANVCMDMMWARPEKTGGYADAFVEVTEWISEGRTARTKEVTHYDMNSGDDACFNLSCTYCTDNDNDGVCQEDDCNDYDASVGKKQAPGTACNDGKATTENDKIQADGCTCAGTVIYVDPCYAKGGDKDGDGVCAYDDCNDYDASVGKKQAPGTACNDGKATTENDKIQSDGCTCAGTVIYVDPCYAKGGDKDGDGICADNDCDDRNPSVGAKKPVGQACNDRNAGTKNDVIQSDGCTCAGTPIICYADGGDSDGDGICDKQDPCPNDRTNSCNVKPSCDAINIAGGPSQITVGNLTAPAEIVQIFNDKWKIVFSCNANCKDTEIIKSLPAGKYYVVVGLFDASWKYICSRKEYVRVTTGTVITEEETTEEETESTNSNMQTETCGDVTVSYGDGKIELTGTAGKNYFYKVSRISPTWKNVINCVRSDCGSTQSASNLPDGRYSIRIYSAGWSPICSEMQIELKTTRGLRETTSTGRSAGSATPPTTVATVPTEAYQVYPNPAQNELFVNLQAYAGHKGSIQLRNQLGQIIQSVTYEELPAETIRLDINRTDNGLHFLTIALDTNEVITEKVMVNRF